MSLQVLKDAGVEGMSLGEIMEVSQSRGLKDWEPGAKRILQFVSTALLNLSSSDAKLGCFLPRSFISTSLHHGTPA